jgi:hypothetical protein
VDEGLASDLIGVWSVLGILGMEGGVDVDEAYGWDSADS